MPTTTQSRREREKEDRKDSIQAAARRVFFQYGFRRATVDRIAGEAGVAKGTVYLYFESKETLLAHLLLEGLNLLLQRLEAAYDEGQPRSAETRLRRLTAAYWGFYNEEQDYFRMLMAFDRGRFQESVKPEVYRQILARSVQGLAWAVRAIRQGVEEGLFAVSDPRTAAGAFWAAVNGVLVLSSHPLRRELLEQEIETLYAQVTETMLRGMRAHKE
ncbi:MAG: TetR/AcrR family transcriptional regulator [Chloroflexi bacterium]|nr:TetR/AcrR family transcriptional regulator [Chloroflexota bacterium]